MHFADPYKDYLRQAGEKRQRRTCDPSSRSLPRHTPENCSRQSNASTYNTRYPELLPLIIRSNSSKVFPMQPC